MSPSFFKTYLNVIGDDVINAVTHFFKSGKLLKAMNHTFITLIPKNDKANKVEQFRPINLYNVSYKIISKIIALKLKPILDKLISPSQSAFYPGRSISDNSIVTHEIMHTINSKSGKGGLMAIKIDMAKSYDRVEWALLIDILVKFGFDQKFVNWIRVCIATTNFSTLVNGSPFGFFSPSRAIRQGDPLSPYIFLLYFDLFSRMLHMEEDHNLLRGIKISRGSLSISHLMYADDLLIFGVADDKNVECIQECIATYEEWSGQCVSKEKTINHFSKNVPRVMRRAVCGVLNFRECNHKSKHLGLPFCKPACRISDYDELLERVGRKLSGWKAKCLAQVGRNVLVKGVAQSIPIYFMALQSIPVAVCERLDKMMRQFWWGDKEGNRGLHLKNWNFLCMPKEFGGLGLRRTRDMNKALISKIAWKICDESITTWKSLLVSKYLRGGHLLNQNETPRTSSKIWKSVMDCTSSLAKGFCFTLSADYHLKTWEDPWLPFIPGFIPSSSHLAEVDIARSYSTRFFINQDTREWDFEKLHEFFPHNMVSKILKIRIPTSLEPRRILWVPSKSGKFTVSTHLFLACPFSRGVWWGSKWSFQLDDFNGWDICRWIGYILDRNNPFFCSEEDIGLEFLTYAVLFMDLTWKNRNKILHGDEPDTIEKIIKLADSKASDHLFCRRSPSCPKSALSAFPAQDILSAPPFTVNIDASFVDGRMCAGMVVTDHNNTFIFGASKTGFAVDACDAETVAIREACRWLEPISFGIIIQTTHFKSNVLKVSIFGHPNNLFQQISKHLHIKEITTTEPPHYCVLWMAPFLSGGGYSSEAWSYILALNSYINKKKNPFFKLSIEHHGDLENLEFWEGLPLDMRNLAIQLHQTECGFNQTTTTIVICHSEPGAWYPPLFQTLPCPPTGYGNGRFKVVIGRTMFETDRVNEEHVRRCNMMDLVWVPTDFHVNTFRQSGVDPMKVRKIVQPVDLEFFDPSKVDPLDLPSISSLVLGSDMLNSEKQFVFLSVFKWEYRKGWDVLLRSYLNEFSGVDNVGLYLLTNAYHSDGDFANKIVEYVEDSDLDKPVNGWAPIYVIDGHVAQVDLPRLYKAADAFALPSRGEGWGRPIVEAMAMSLPVITTNWSGPTEYLRNENSYPLPFRGMSEVKEGPFKGHMWAEPCVAMMQLLMRHVMSNPGEAKIKGMKGRLDMMTRFSPEIVAEDVIKHIQEIVDNFR
ncbi:hypothetical protein BUALT_Bualt06G0040000 [Buddleja alternifolia]|uniref:Reverse transcriptase domain-containing protein n=1 Tax=Buddleja alternifolia TaxID=168488 RepID=A0AAV6XNQ7_9LAMI|nr:hypothetical protein BUALT_Bualt06G0040000 [Buddleja alternifolia]